jgi:hypothetical protein
MAILAQGILALNSLAAGGSESRPVVFSPPPRQKNYMIIESTLF